MRLALATTRPSLTGGRDATERQRFGERIPWRSSYMTELRHLKRYSAAVAIACTAQDAGLH